MPAMAKANVELRAHGHAGLADLMRIGDVARIHRLTGRAHSTAQKTREGEELLKTLLAADALAAPR